MKRTIALLLSLVMITAMSSCSSSGSSENCSSSEQVQTTEPVKAPEPVQLKNKMTDNELQFVEKHELTLLDKFEKPSTDPNAEHKVSVEFMTIDLDEWRASLEENRAEMDDEQYSKALENIQKAEESGGEYRIPKCTLVDGYMLLLRVPYEDPFYDGGTITFDITQCNENGEPEAKTYSFDTFDEYMEFLKKNAAELLGYTDEETETTIFQMRLANEALKNGTYETLPEGSVDFTDDSMSLSKVFHNHRSDWEYDRDAVEAIKDSVDEISIYDDELGEEFTVHVTLPPDYDENKTYPVFFLTDGIWRFGNCPELRKCMENGEAAPVILASLYYSYDVTDPDQEMRFVDLVLNRKELLDFITDNLMPYLCENYNIDCGNSTLYGHSDGGVFTHYALFNSDKYDNQPFGHYIIGSPAFWGLFHNDKKEYVLNDYDYFDRNEKLNKTVFLCAGSLEDPDYAHYYREGDDTTLEGVAKLKERLEAHGADLTYKLYESHHYQFIPEMLIEYLKQTYPC